MHSARSVIKIAMEDKWILQSLPKDAGEARILNSFEYESVKSIGSSLTVLDFWMHKNKIKKVVVFITNIFVNPKKNKIPRKEGTLCFYIPAWADPAVWLDCFDPQYENMLSTYSRVLYAVAGSAVPEVSDILSDVQRVEFTSDYYNGAVWATTDSFAKSTMVRIGEEGGDKMATFERALLFLPQHVSSAIVVVITRSGTKEPIGLDRGILSCDHVRVYLYDSMGYSKYKTLSLDNTYSIISNSDLCQEMLRSDVDFVVLLRSGVSLFMVKCKMDDLRSILSLDQSLFSMSTTVVMDKYENVSEVCRPFVYKVGKMILLPADRVLFRNINATTAKFGDPKCTRDACITKICGYPFYCLGKKTPPMVFPPHLRGLAINLQDRESVDMTKLMDIKRMKRHVKMT